MIAIRFCLLAAVAIVSVQGYKMAKPLTPSSNIEYDNVVKHITSRTNEVIKEATSTLKAAANAKIATATQKHQAALKEIEEHIQNLLSELNEAELSCVEPNKAKISELSNSIRNSLKECLEGTVETVLQMYAEYVQIMNDSFDTIFNIVGEYYECTDSDCRWAVVEKLLFAMIDINIKVRTIIAEGVEFIQSQLPEIIECIKGIEGNYREAAAVIRNDIKQCSNNNKHL